MAYFAFTAFGVLLAMVAVRFVPRDDDVPAAVAVQVRLAAIVGAIAGAWLLELPAEWFGWAPPVAAHATFGARTVLGGLLGGWAAVEAWKWRLGYRGPTGDRFALPLAIALAIGRLGCVVTGCCPGAPLEADDGWARVSLLLGQAPRFPATLLEAWFHALAAAALVLAMATGALRHARLAAYLSLYAVVRFGLELVRDVPRPFFGLSWYQLLSLGLLALAGSTLIRRVGRPAVPLAPVP